MRYTGTLRVELLGHADFLDKLAPHSEGWKVLRRDGQRQVLDEAVPAARPTKRPAVKCLLCARMPGIQPLCGHLHNQSNILMITKLMGRPMVCAPCAATLETAESKCPTLHTTAAGLELLHSMEAMCNVGTEPVDKRGRCHAIQKEQYIANHIPPPVETQTTGAGGP